MGSPMEMGNHCSTEAPILASSDIHSPLYLKEFRKSLLEYKGEKPCLFLLAGDIIDKGNVEAAAHVFNSIYSRFGDIKIVSVFGNEEYHDRENLLIKRYGSIIWLNDTYTIINCSGINIGIIGTRGALQRPTRWQRLHMPWLWKIYKERPRILKGLIETARKDSDLIILLSHYALTKHTIRGEPTIAWPEIYSPAMEKLLIETRPNAAVHGHAHRGSPYALLNGIPVYNVAFPLNKKPVKICPKRHITLLDYK